MNCHKGNSKQPIMVLNPFNDKWVNMYPLFKRLDDIGFPDNISFNYFSKRIDEDVIRFVNESCVMDEDTGHEARQMFFLLYTLRDMFEEMEIIKN